MKTTTLFLVTLLCYTFSLGQTAQSVFKYPVKGKQVLIDVHDASISVEGYNGNQLIIEGYTLPASAPVLAGGLTSITPVKGEVSVIHPEVLKNEAALFSVHIAKSNCRHLRIKVPAGTHLKLTFKITLPDAKIDVKNLTGELEVEGTAPNIEFSNITGPLTLSPGNGEGITGKVTISHLQIAPNNPSAIDKNRPLINVISDFADIDISLPENMQATIQADLMNYGNLYTGLGLVPIKPNAPPVKNRYTGNLNGGGRMIVINAYRGNVFIRKQQ